MQVILDKKELINCASKLIKASISVNEAKTKIYSAYNMSEYSCTTKIHLAMDSINLANNNLASLVKELEQSELDLLAAMVGSNFEINGSDGRTMTITSSDGTEYVVNRDSFDTDFTAELLGKYGFLNSSDQKNGMSFTEGGTLDSFGFSFDIATGKVFFAGEEVNSWKEFSELAFKYGSPALKAYLNHEERNFANENAFYNDYAVFAEELEKITNSKNGGDQKLTSYELSLAMCETTLFPVSIANDNVDVNKGFDGFTDGDVTLFQADRTAEEILYLNQYALEQGRSIDVLTVEGLALMYLALEHSELFEMIDFDSTKSDFAVKSDYNIALREESNISNDSDIAMFEAYYSRNCLNSFNADNDFRIAIYRKKDVENEDNYEYGEWGDFKFKQDDYSYYQPSLSISEIMQENPEIGKLLQKDYKDLTEEEIKMLSESEYCISISVNSFGEYQNESFIDLGTNAQLRQKWETIDENNDIGSSIIEDTDWHTLIATRGNISEGTYTIYDTKVDKDGNVIAVRITPTDDVERWVYLSDLNNSSTENDGTNLVIKDGNVNVYGGSDDNFITFLNSLSSGLWVDSKTGDSVTANDANKILKLFQGGNYEDAIQLMESFHYNSYGTNYDKNCLDFLEESGFTIESITNSRDVIGRDDTGKPVWLYTIGSTAGQAGMYTIGGVVGFFENIWDGAVSGLGWVAYAPVDLFQKIFGNTESVSETYEDALKRIKELEKEGYFYQEHTLEEVMKEVFGIEFSKEYYTALRDLGDNILTKDENGEYIYSDALLEYITKYNNNLVEVFDNSLGGISQHEEKLDEYIFGFIEDGNASTETISAIYSLVDESYDIKYDTDAFGNKVISQESLEFLKENINKIEYTDESLKRLMELNILESYKVSNNNNESVTLAQFLFNMSYNDSYMDESLKYADILKQNYVGEEDFEYLDQDGNKARYTEHLYLIMALDLMNSTEYSNMIKQSIANNKEVVDDKASVTDEYGNGKIAYLNQVEELVEQLVAPDLSYNLAHSADDILNEYGAIEGTMWEGVFTSIGEMLPILVGLNLANTRAISLLSKSQTVKNGAQAMKLASKAAKWGKAANVLQPTLIFSSAYGKTFESTYQDPRFANASMHQRFFYSVISGTIEAAVEQAGIGGSTFGGLEALDAFKIAFKKKSKAAWVDAFLNLGWSSSMEGVEEIISGFCEPFNAFIVLHRDTAVLKDDLGNYIFDAEFVEDFLSGFASAGIMNVGGISLNRIATAIQNSSNNRTFNKMLKNAYSEDFGLTMEEWLACGHSVADLITSAETGNVKAKTLIEFINANSELVKARFSTFEESVKNEIKAAISSYTVGTDIKNLYDSLSLSVTTQISLAEFSNMLMNRSVLVESTVTNQDAVIEYKAMTADIKAKIDAIFNEKLGDIIADSANIFELYKNGCTITNADGTTSNVKISELVSSFNTWNALCQHFVNLKTYTNITLTVDQSSEINTKLADMIDRASSEEISIETEYESLSDSLKSAGITLPIFESLFNDMADLTDAPIEKASSAIGVSSGGASSFFKSHTNQLKDEIDHLFEHVLPDIKKAIFDDYFAQKKDYHNVYNNLSSSLKNAITFKDFEDLINNTMSTIGNIFNSWETELVDYNSRLTAQQTMDPNIEKILKQFDDLLNNHIIPANGMFYRKLHDLAKLQGEIGLKIKHNQLNTVTMVDGIEIRQYGINNKRLNKMYIQFLKALKRIDPRMKRFITAIELFDDMSPSRNECELRYYPDSPFDMYYDVAGLAYANEGKISLFPCSMPTLTSLTYVVNHEIGHIIDSNFNKLIFELNSTRYYGISKSNIWSNAQTADFHLNGKKAVTKYGETKIVEDFADSFKLYFRDVNFKTNFPNRYKVINDLLTIVGYSESHDLNDLGKISRLIPSLENNDIKAIFQGKVLLYNETVNFKFINSLMSSLFSAISVNKNSVSATLKNGSTVQIENTISIDSTIENSVKKALDKLKNFANLDLTINGTECIIKNRSNGSEYHCNINMLNNLSDILNIVGNISFDKIAGINFSNNNTNIVLKNTGTSGQNINIIGNFDVNTINKVLNSLSILSIDIIKNFTIDVTTDNLSIELTNGNTLDGSLKLLDDANNLKTTLNNLNNVNNTFITIKDGNHIIKYDGIEFQFNNDLYNDNLTNISNLAKVISDSNLNDVTKVNFKDSNTIEITYKDGSNIKNITVSKFDVNTINENLNKSTKGGNRLTKLLSKLSIGIGLLFTGLGMLSFSQSSNPTYLLAIVGGIGLTSLPILPIIIKHKGFSFITKGIKNIINKITGRTTTSRSSIVTKIKNWFTTKITKLTRIIGFLTIAIGGAIFSNLFVVGAGIGIFLFPTFIKSSLFTKIVGVFKGIFKKIITKIKSLSLFTNIINKFKNITIFNRTHLFRNVFIGFIISLTSIPVFVYVWDKYEENKDNKFYLSLYGETSIEIFINNVYEEPGYYAYDSIDGYLTDKVVVTGKVDHKKIGEYLLTYTVTNSREETITKTRNVKVIHKTSVNNNTIKEKGNIVEITLDDFNEQIEKGKVYNGINMQTSALLNQYISKFMLQKRLVYAVSITSITKKDNRYSDIYACNNSYLNTEASGMIVTNGTLERVYNKDNNCFSNYGVFYFTKNKLNHTKVNSESINQAIIDSGTRNTFIYQDIIVDNSAIVNDSTNVTKNNALCQSGPNTLKLFSFDKEISYSDLGKLMLDNSCQTGVLLTEGDTIIYKSQYSSTLNVQRGTDNYTDSIIFFYQKSES